MKHRAGLLIAVTLAALGIILLGRKVVMTEKLVKYIAEGIAFAEGFYRPGSRPARNHNPGNMKRDITGKGIGRDEAFIVYKNDNDGWAALRKQVSLMLYGGSAYYTSSMSIIEVARKWTMTEQAAWAANVAAKLGVSTQTRLQDIKVRAA